MSIKITSNDFVLQNFDTSEEVRDLLNKYDAFLEALSSEHYGFQRAAAKAALQFFFSKQYSSLSDLASANYDANDTLKSISASRQEYLKNIPLKEKKACSIDLATGTGKSFVMFGVAMILLAEKLVDRVLVLCPSLTIEEELTKKFKSLTSDHLLCCTLQEVQPGFVLPEIINANETILPNQICIENIHATYDRTGSSIETLEIGRASCRERV